MRATIISIAVAIAALSAVLRADPPTSDQFDFDKINSSIKAAMDPVVATSAIFSKFTYVIDPELTDLAQDQYSVDMEIIGKEPWSDQNFTTHTKLTLGYDPEVDSESLNLAYDLDVSTDTLALIRHHAAKSEVCDVKSKAIGALRVTLTEDCKTLPRLENVQSFDELFAIFRDHIDSVKISMANYQAELTKAVAVVSSDLASDALQAQLSEVGRYLEGASKVQLTRTSDGVSLVIPDFPVLGILDMKGLSLDFSPAKMRAVGNLSVQLGRNIYEAIKPEILQILKDLEGDQDYVKQLIQMETRFWLRLMEDHISSQDE